MNSFNRKVFATCKLSKVWDETIKPVATSPNTQKCQIVQKNGPSLLLEQNSTAELGTGRHQVDKARNSEKNGFVATPFRS